MHSTPTYHNPHEK